MLQTLHRQRKSTNRFGSYFFIAALVYSSICRDVKLDFRVANTAQLRYNCLCDKHLFSKNEKQRILDN